MMETKILTLRLHISNKVGNELGQKGYVLDIKYIENNKISSELLLLPIKEAAYLAAWLETDGVVARTNSKELGYLKASKLAHILSPLDITSIRFDSDGSAYTFFKKHFDSRWLQLILGFDYDEVSIKLEQNPEYKVLGGYLGGESESKDKTRFKSFLASHLVNKSLLECLLPSPVKNKKGKRIQNQFQFNSQDFQVILS